MSLTFKLLSTAPCGKTPVLRKRQSAMRSLRATIPIRLKHLPPLPKRSRNPTLRPSRVDTVANPAPTPWSSSAHAGCHSWYRWSTK